MNSGAVGQVTDHRFAALDSLRGIVAMIVAGHHLNARSPFFGQSFFQAGVQAVDFFFVLSGFVIAASYSARLSQGYRPGRFLWLRLGRIWPVHALMVLSYVVIETAVAMSGETGLTGRTAFEGPRDPAFLPLNLTLIQCLWPSACMSWNVQSSSISVELMLYLLVALFWPRARRSWWAWGLALALVAGLMVDHAVLAQWSKVWRGCAASGWGRRPGRHGRSGGPC